MRMSDWSSDVCSSDLHGRRERPGSAGLRRQWTQSLPTLSGAASWQLSGSFRHSAALRRIQDTDSLLPLGFIDPNEMILFTLLKKRNALAHQRIEQNHPGPGLFVVAGGVERIEYGGNLVSVHQLGRAHVCTPVTNAHLVCR